MQKDKIDDILKAINKIADKKSRIKLILLFYSEISGWLNHLENIGMSWGATADNDRVCFEIKKTISTLENLNGMIISEVL